MVWGSANVYCTASHKGAIKISKKGVSADSRSDVLYVGTSINVSCNTCVHWLYVKISAGKTFLKESQRKNALIYSISFNMHAFHSYSHGPER